MSGGMKYAAVILVQGSILAVRATQEGIETIKRLEAEKATLASSLITAKDGFIPLSETVQALLTQQKPNVLPADHANLCKRIAAADAALVGARSHITLQEAVQELGRIKNDIDRACRRKEAEDARTGQSPGMNALRARYDNLKQAAGTLFDTPEGPLGPAGAAAAIKSALAAVGGALQTNNEAKIAANLGRLENAVQEYEDSLLELSEQEARQAAVIRQLTSEATAIIAGMRADPVVMRWHAGTVDALETDLTNVDWASLTDPEARSKVIETARESSAAIVKEADAAQIKADQRDYIAQSISSTLIDMGFMVSEPIEEHPGHPATASILHAATTSGKAIAVSVPVEGQVWYNVEGYVKTVEAAVGGGEAAVCDEAQEVIEQMHDALDQEFQIQMGELNWEGKDPKRKLRAAKSVPRNGTSSRGIR
jgi:hypothetical protein